MCGNNTYVLILRVSTFLSKETCHTNLMQC